jgi:hypothetical protein
MKPKVPFYSNTPDDTHCVQAVLRMVLKYFLPEKEFSWRKLEKMTAKKKGKWTWSMQGMLNLKKMGFDIVNMEDFDYKRFSKEGGKYLIEKWGKEMGEAQIKNSDIPQEMKIAKEFVKVFGSEFRIPSLGDIRKLLSQGYLVVCSVNFFALDGKKGYAGHSVLVFDSDEKNIFLHDPGRPPRKNRKVPIIRFIKAWAYPTAMEKNLTAYRYRP